MGVLRLVRRGAGGGRDGVEVTAADDPDDDLITDSERHARGGIRAARDLARERGRHDVADEMDAHLTADRKSQDLAWAERHGIVRQ